MLEFLSKSGSIYREKNIFRIILTTWCESLTNGGEMMKIHQISNAQTSFSCQKPFYLLNYSQLQL